MSLLLILMEQQSPSINFFINFLYNFNALITNGLAMPPILYCFFCNAAILQLLVVQLYLFKTILTIIVICQVFPCKLLYSLKLCDQFIYLVQ